MSAPVNFIVFTSPDVLFTSVADANNFFGNLTVSSATTGVEGVVKKALLPAPAIVDLTDLTTKFNQLLSAMQNAGQGQ